MVAMLIEELPEGARYTAIMSAPDRREAEGSQPAPPPDPEAIELEDRRFWTSERRFVAQQINALHQLIVLAGNWKKGKEPEFPVIGPLEWQPEEVRNKHKPSGPVSVADAMKAFGWTGQIQK